MEEKNKEVTVNIGNYTGEKPIEVIIRNGEAAKAPNPLPTKEPIKVCHAGVISTPLEWLKKRVDTIDQKRANIVVNREAMTITLTINEDDQYTTGVIKGSVELSETFAKLGINNDRIGWEPNKLGKYFRINRALFTDREKNMVLVSLLNNFTANAKNEIQKQKDPSGSRADVYRSEVKSNLPKSFVISLPIFKGTQKVEMEVEFDHYLSDGECWLLLVAPGISDVIEEYRDQSLDAVINEIRVVAPDIAILEI